MKRKAVWLSLLSLLLSPPALAADCWGQAATEAAQVKQFDIMLMVSTLRCHGKGVDFASDYNRFVREKRVVLRAAGHDIVRQFNRSMGSKAAFNAYDHLSVVMANRFGNGVAGLDCADMRAIVDNANAAPADRASLVGLAQHAGMEPPLPQPRCGMPVAARETAQGDVGPGAASVGHAIEAGTP